MVAFSAGSAFALACAVRLHQRVSAIALVSPSGPLEKPGFVEDMAAARYMKLARRAPWAMAAMYGTVARRGRKDPHSAHEMFFRGSSRVDREVLDRPAVKARWMEAYLAATEKRGGRGFVEDMRVIQEPWGFDPGDVSVPVHVWSGDADRIAPRRHAEYWVETLPHCRPTWCGGEGHFLIEDRIGETLDALGHRVSGAR